METRDIKMKAFFGSDVQCVIPLFQRHYVWDREAQWEPLWKDMREKTNQRIVRTSDTTVHAFYRCYRHSTETTETDEHEPSSNI